MAESAGVDLRQRLQGNQSPCCPCRHRLISIGRLDRRGPCQRPRHHALCDRSPTCRFVVAIGSSAETLVQAAGPGRSAVAISMDEAVAIAMRSGPPGDTVLLAPGCASFDMFDDYAARGDAFVAAVRAVGQRRQKRGRSGMTGNVTSIAKVRAAARRRTDTRPGRTTGWLRSCSSPSWCSWSWGSGEILSASSIRGIADAEDRFFYFKRQLIGLGVGVVAMVVIARIPYRAYLRLAMPFYFTSSRPARRGLVRRPGPQRLPAMARSGFRHLSTLRNLQARSRSSPWRLCSSGRAS